MCTHAHVCLPVPLCTCLCTVVCLHRAVTQVVFLAAFPATQGQDHLCPVQEGGLAMAPLLPSNLLPFYPVSSPMHLTAPSE